VSAVLGSGLGAREGSELIQVTTHKGPLLCCVIIKGILCCSSLLFILLVCIQHGLLADCLAPEKDTLELLAKVENRSFAYKVPCRRFLE